jgi:hypothetical protein
MVYGRVVKLFGSHVLWRSPGLSGGHTGWAPHLAGKAEVSKCCLSLGVEENITRLHVTMNQPVAVRCLQPIGYL